jgi:predicted RNA binding protein YcfA (HicA-like mRNA interferase family)
MPKGFYKELVAEIKILGFEYWKPAKGSHEKWHNPATGVILLIPYSLDKRHTANGILKDAGSTKKF